MVTPTAGAHVVGAAPVEKNEVSASVGGRLGAVQCHDRQIGRLAGISGGVVSGPARR